MSKNTWKQKKPTTKDKYIKLRVSSQEKSLLNKKASERDCSVSQYILLKTINEENECVISSKNELLLCAKELNYIGNNLNQTAKALNTILHIYKSKAHNLECEEIENSITELHSLQTEFIKTCQTLRQKLTPINRK